MGPAESYPYGSHGFTFGWRLKSVNISHAASWRSMPANRSARAVGGPFRDAVDHRSASIEHLHGTVLSEHVDGAARPLRRCLDVDTVAAVREAWIESDCHRDLRNAGR